MCRRHWANTPFITIKSKNTYKRKSPDDSRKNYPEISIYHYTTITTDVLHTYTQHHLRQADARRVMLQVLKYAIGSCSLYLYFIVWIYLSQLYLFRIQFPSVLLYRTFLILSISFDVFIWEKFNWVWKIISEHTTFGRNKCDIFSVAYKPAQISHHD